MAQPSGEVNKLNLRFSLSIPTLAFLFAFIFLLSPNTANAAEVTIGLSLQATDGNTNNNITIQSPSGGGIAVGRHTLVINTNSYKGYNVTLNSSTDSNWLTNTNDSSETIAATDGTLSEPSVLVDDDTWGVAIPGKSGFNNEADYVNNNSAAKYAAIPLKGSTDSNIIAKGSPSAANGDNQPVVYGVKTASLTKAGSYKATVTYTATAQLPAKPTITSITPNSYQLGTDIATNPNTSKITIAGTDLGSTNEVYIDTNGNSQKDTGEECTNLTIQSDNSITCNVPTADVNAGTYNVHLSAQGGETVKTGGFTYKAADIPVESITINGDNTVDVGGTLQLTATITPDNATDKTITWSSSDDTIASVDQTGKVTGKNTGTVTITAISSNGMKATKEIAVAAVDSVRILGTANDNYNVPPAILSDNTIRIGASSYDSWVKETWWNVIQRVIISRSASAVSKVAECRSIDNTLYVDNTGDLNCIIPGNDFNDYSGMYAIEVDGNNDAYVGNNGRPLYRD